ncbi:hypothetical protein CIHG_06036 [Coccidioides immitis H538.4]|uniref:Uncharacterized protein n=2 Tax=Coccidioides immitis TaxID=5501 RepID=A0A0J8UJK6_COCIT|nr:hypothetical protein CIRG_01786 [Coccidioides immitis RMSCC 2394]KMU87643.1 hypothetical protein CIHG_06036 [Coccidioides immitis H538.4]
MKWAEAAFRSRSYVDLDWEKEAYVYRRDGDYKRKQFFSRSRVRTPDTYVTTSSVLACRDYAVLKDTSKACAVHAAYDLTSELSTRLAIDPGQIEDQMGSPGPPIRYPRLYHYPAKGVPASISYKSSKLPQMDTRRVESPSWSLLMLPREIRDEILSLGLLSNYTCCDDASCDIDKCLGADHPLISLSCEHAINSGRKKDFRQGNADLYAIYDLKAVSNPTRRSFLPANGGMSWNLVH